jgi:hypothetical protein
MDHSSRWLPSVDDPSAISAPSSSSTKIASKKREWLIVDFEKPVVVKKVGFGKYFRNHPCTLKDWIVQTRLEWNERAKKQSPWTLDRESGSLGESAKGKGRGKEEDGEKGWIEVGRGECKIGAAGQEGDIEWFDVAWVGEGDVVSPIN